MRAPGHAGWSLGTWAPAPFWRPLWDLWIPELWKGAHPPELGARRVSPGCSWHGWGCRVRAECRSGVPNAGPTPADLAVSDATPASLSQERTMKSLGAEGRGDEEGTAGGCRARWGRHRPLEGGRVAASGGTTSGRGKRCPRRRGFGGSHSPTTRSTFRERQVRGTERRPSCGARPAPPRGRVRAGPALTPGPAPRSPSSVVPAEPAAAARTGDPELRRQVSPRRARGRGGRAAGDGPGAADARGDAGSEGAGVSIGDPHSPPTASPPGSPPPSALLGPAGLGPLAGVESPRLDPRVPGKRLRGWGRFCPEEARGARDEGWSGAGSAAGGARILEDAATLNQSRRL